MSYILDALKKAAEAREEQAPAMDRLMAPSPATVSTWPAYPVTLALSVGAAGVIALLILSLRPTALPVPAGPRDAVKAVTVAPAPTVLRPLPQPVTPTAPARAERPEPATRTPVAVEAPRPQARPVAPPASASVPRLPVVTILPPVTTPSPVTTPPAVATAPAMAIPEGAAHLRLEVLVYSDVAAERMVFINGRKYVQGDTVAERARLEEIQQDGVVLSEQGRRFTLKQ